MIWVTAQECLGLPGLPTAVHNIRTNLDKLAGTQRRKRIGSKAFEYPYTVLLPVTRAAVLRQRNVVEVANKQIKIKPSAANYNQEILWQDWESSSSAQRERAKTRCEAAIVAAGLIETGIDTLSAFASVSEALSIPAASVQRWYYQVKPYDRSDWLPVLLSKHGKNLETRKKKEADISVSAWEFFLGDFLRLEKPSLRTCYYRLTEAAKKNRWVIPSLSSLRRKVERDIPREQLVLLREGEHALMRLYPPQERSVLDLDALEWINGDGYRHNVFVTWFNGEVLRPTTWLWQDVRTRKILAWRVDVSENTDSIRLSLSDLIAQYGIPRHITIDNTRAAANKKMTGGVANRYRFKVKTDDPIGIIPALGIELHWTSVLFGRGHGQAKPIERAFSHGGLGELVDKHPLLAGAYTGANPLSKPSYKSKPVDISIFLQALEAGIAAFNRRPSRQTEVCKGQFSFDQAFDESYVNSQIRKATVEQQRLLLLCSEAVRVQNGTFVLESGGQIARQKNRYYNEQLINIRPSSIVVRFDPQSLHDSVSCYTVDGRYICDAICINKAAFGDTQTAREHDRNRKQFIKKTKQASKAQQRMTTLEVAELLPTIHPIEIPETRVVELFQPVGNAVRKSQPETESYDDAFNKAVALLREQKSNSI